MAPKPETSLEKRIQDAERAHLENRPVSETDLRQALQESHALLAQAQAKIAQLEAQRAKAISHIQQFQRVSD
ncbi:hypothetical protein Hypma_006895 [Hypsizygus marmoreus]|uniref:Uncharacterized protein n=1 Tax=Hypsizygus marmoreus TaxID=39966 RepID=A0A369K1F9_HYPMA|nr:hypothetical protein Hypma_006895 [Hypsizygus marmoreus]